MEKTRKKIGIVCCSNGLKPSYAKKLHSLEQVLGDIGLELVFSDCIYAENDIFSASPKRRAEDLMKFYKDDEIEDIFDISGGDLANGILPYLDYDYIQKSNKCFYGYSDLTTVLNAIYAKTGKVSGLYQIRNVLSEYKEQHKKDIWNLYKCTYYDKSNLYKEEISSGNLIYDDTGVLSSIKRDVSSGVIDRNASLFHFDYQFVQGQSMEGVMIGGNIRCFLKLAGTSYMPNFEGKILLLESRSGLVPQMETFLSQLQQLGAFDKIAGILLGTFTQMEKERERYLEENVNLKKLQCFDGFREALSLKDNYYPSMADLIRGYVKADLPIAITNQIGHGQDSKAIQIGAFYKLTNADAIVTIDDSPKVVKTIIDTTEENPVELLCEEEFYEDENYEYSFGMPISDYVIVKYTDGTKQNVKEALEEGNIEITDLNTFGITYYAEPKHIK